MKNERITYSMEFKKHIVKLYNKGSRISTLSKEYNVSRVTIKKWITEYSLNEEASKILEKQIEKINDENQILRDSNKIINPINIYEIIKFINNNKDKYKISVMCKVFGIPRSTYYNMLKKMQCEGEKHETINIDSNVGENKYTISSNDRILKGYTIAPESEQSIKNKGSFKSNFNILGYAIYDEMNTRIFELEKKYLMNEFDINVIVDIINKDNIIEDIYNNCYTQAHEYSWEVIKNNILSRYVIKNNDYESGYMDDTTFEKSIYIHCITSALYTVQYLRYKGKYATSSQVGNRIKGMGHNNLLNSEEYKGRYSWLEEGIKFDRLSKYIEAFKIKDDYKSVLYNMDESDKIRKNFDELYIFIKGKQKEQEEQIIQNKKIVSYFLSRIICIKTEGQERSYTRKIPIFLSNFSYSVLDNLKAYIDVEENIEKIDNLIGENESDSNQIIPKKKDIIEKYLEYAKAISYYDEFTTNVDKLLFKIEKERQLNDGYIKFCLSKGLLWDEEIESLLIVPNVMACPNVFSRDKFIYYLNYICKRYEYGYDCAGKILDKFIDTILPVFEKTFFISLYGYALQSDSEKNPLKFMDDSLTAYVENNFNEIVDTFKTEDTVFPVEEFKENKNSINSRDFFVALFSSFMEETSPQNPTLYYSPLEIATSYVDNNYDEIMSFLKKKNMTFVDKQLENKINKAYELVEFNIKHLHLLQESLISDYKIRRE